MVCGLRITVSSQFGEIFALYGHNSDGIRLQEATELAECPASFVPGSRNYGGQDDATGSMRLLGPMGCHARGNGEPLTANAKPLTR